MIWGMRKQVEMKLKKQNRVIAGLVILTVAVLTPILCIKLLTPPAAEEGIEDDADGIEGHAIASVVLTPEEIRDPEIALQYGFLGYVELTWMDALPPSAMRPGETWTGRWLAHFVSHTCEVTEAELHIQPGLGTDRAWACFRREDGTQGRYDLTRFLSYGPLGVFKMNADETMVIRVTIRVPTDLPRRIQDFWLHPFDIWVGEHQGKMPRVELLVPDHPREVQVIHDPLPLDDP